MSKAELIATAEAEIHNASTFEFSNLWAELKKKGIDESEPIMKTIQILKNQTFESCSAKKAVLAERTTKKLKILSILTHFYECETYDLNKLSRQLSSSKEECINLLLQASINKLVTVKIDEPRGKIVILNSKVREREVKAQTVSLCNDKLLQIKEKNSRVENNLTNLINIVDPQKKNSEAKSGGDIYQTILSSFRMRH